MIGNYPKGLYFLFLTEMWERFSYYGISAILILYLTTGLGLSDKEAALTSGAYIAFTFMTPVLGGLAADYVLGLRHSVTVGGAMILLGNLILTRGSDPYTVFCGLAAVAMGTGFLKSTVSVIVGKLYQQHDCGRDSGYTLFYMGINCGALLAGVLVTYAAIRYGWTTGFYLSAAGMAVGLYVFQFGHNYYNNAEDGYDRHKLFLRHWGVSNVLWIIICSIVIYATMVYLFAHSDQTKLVIIWLSGGLFVSIALLAFFCENIGERHAMLSILIIIAAAVCFHTYFKQMNNSMTLFVDRDFDKGLLNSDVIASFFCLVPNSLCVLMFAGIFTRLWRYLAKIGMNPPITLKIAIAIALSALSSALLSTIGAHVAASGQKASDWWMIVAIAILTCGELCILPMGLSAISELAPKRYAALLMGAWFLASSIGGYTSGVIASIAEIPRSKIHDVVYTAHVYSDLYYYCSIALIGVVVVMLVATPLVKKVLK